MRCGARRGSYFFVIDAFIAGIIIAGTLVVIYGQNVQTVDDRQVFYAAEGFLQVLESTTIQDYDSETVREYVAAGIITDPARSLLDEIAQQHLNWTRKVTDHNGADPGYSAVAGNLSRDLEKDVPENVGVRIVIEGTDYGVQDGAVAPEDSRVFFVSKRILLLSETPTDLYEPMVFEVHSWQ